MCFSVTASFTASLVLITCGVAALHYAQEKRLRMIAAVPLIFGLQQCAEGFVWASFMYPSLAAIRMIAAYIFAACAGIVWPIWVPLAIARYEGPQRYARYVPSLIAGAIHASAYILCFFGYQLSVTMQNNMVYNFAIDYGSFAPWSSYISIIFALLYVIATIVPFFLARNRILWIIGFLITMGYIVSYVRYYEAFASVWCFFAAIISVLVCWLVYDHAQYKGRVL